MRKEIDQEASEVWTRQASPCLHFRPVTRSKVLIPVRLVVQFIASHAVYFSYLVVLASYGCRALAGRGGAASVWPSWLSGLPVLQNKVIPAIKAICQALQMYHSTVEQHWLSPGLISMMADNMATSVSDVSSGLKTSASSNCSSKKDPMYILMITSLHRRY